MIEKGEERDLQALDKMLRHGAYAILDGKYFVCFVVFVLVGLSCADRQQNKRVHCTQNTNTHKKKNKIKNKLKLTKTEDDSAAQKFQESNIDEILTSATRKVETLNPEGGGELGIHSFTRSNFESNEADSNLDMNADDFWAKVNIFFCWVCMCFVSMFYVCL